MRDYAKVVLRGLGLSSEVRNTGGGVLQLVADSRDGTQIIISDGEGGLLPVNMPLPDDVEFHADRVRFMVRAWCPLARHLPHTPQSTKL